jgi:hypothetical protein
LDCKGAHYFENGKIFVEIFSSKKVQPLKSANLAPLAGNYPFSKEKIVINNNIFAGIRN